MKGLRGRAALAVIARERLELAAAVAGVGRQNARHVGAIEDLENRIEDAQRSARTSANTARSYLDDALGYDREGDVESAAYCYRRAESCTESEEDNLRTAQAIRNEWRVRRWEARKSAA